MFRIFPLVAGIAAVIVMGLSHGFLDGRWSTNNELKASGHKLDQVPLNIADWEGQKLENLTDESLAIGEIAGYLNRQYTRKGTNRALSVLVLCGRPGPIAAHRPEVCLGGEGFQVAERTHNTVQVKGLSAPAEVLVGHFERKDIGAHRRLFWTFSADGTWVSPDSPRVKFALERFPPYPAIYKVYIQQMMTGPDDPVDDAHPAFELIKALLPELNSVLFPGGLKR